MEKTDMPANISYTLLIHGGSYKDFLTKLATQFPEMKIVDTKVKAVHYYVVQITETGKEAYKKKDIYTLPIMAMREEFSNYLFFKKIKAYNNALKSMCGGDKNPNAPYDLFKEMLTGIEKYKFAEIDKDTKTISYTILNEKNEEIITTLFNKEESSSELLMGLFKGDKIKVNDKEIEYIDILKKQKLMIGLI